MNNPTSQSDGCCAHCISKHRQADERGIERSFCPCHKKEVYYQGGSSLKIHTGKELKNDFDTPSPASTWREEFDKEFSSTIMPEGTKVLVYRTDVINSFIESLLSRHTEEYKKELIEKIEALKVDRPCTDTRCDGTCQEGQFRAIRRIKSLIQKDI